MRHYSALLFFFLCIILNGRTQTLCLDSRCGAKWMAKVEGLHEPFPVSIPGYWPQGMDTSGRWSEALQQQMNKYENSEVEYYCDFYVHERFLENTSVQLIASGIDLYAAVTLNGKPLWRKTDNMFVQWETEVKKYLRPGVNRLSFQFVPLPEGLSTQNPNRALYPADNEETQEKFGPFMRKAPYQFGWDFAPRAVVPGIWRSVKLVGHTGQWITAVKMDSLLISAEMAKPTFTVAYKSESPFKGTIKAGWIQSTGDTLFQTTAVAHHAVGGLNQESSLQLSVTIPDPKLWWPAGMGEAQLYEFVFLLQNENGQTQSVKSLRTGLRTIELVQEPDAIGQSFYFKVNGKPVFARGTNYVPPSVFPSVAHLPGQNLREMFETFGEGHFNMVRVWGGGVYPSDEFYSLADEFGILIWQDFMFACAMHDPNSFGASFDKEITQTVNRLKSHPSLALWCGNNEIDVAWHNWGWQEKYKIGPGPQQILWDQYQQLFDSLLPASLKALDPARPYVPTSPLSNWGKPEDFTRGDNHYWGVYHGEAPFAEYETHVPRFASEYGFQSFPTPQTFRQFVPESNWSLDSPAVAKFQKSYKGNGLLVKYMENEMGFVPNDFYNFMLLTQTLQARAYTQAITAHRSATGHCMGSLYWQFNDCWPGITWSTIDYLGAPKASWYAVRDAMNPLRILTSQRNDTIEISLLNSEQKETYEPLNASLYTGKKRLRSFTHSFNDIPVFPNEITSVLYWIKSGRGSNARKSSLFIAANGSVHCDSLIHYFVPVQELKLSRPKVEAVIVQRADEATVIELRSRNLVKDLWLDFVSGDAHAVIPSLNHFDLLPGKTQRITVEGNWTEVRLSSLYERRKSKAPFLVLKP